MEKDNRIEQALFKILDYRSQHNMDDDSILIMLSLLNLMGMVNVLAAQKGDGVASAGSSSGSGNMEALLGPLLALLASGTGKGPAAGGGQNAFNPAALWGLVGGGLGGGRGKGGTPDLGVLLGLLGPLLGLGGSGSSPGGAPDRADGAAGDPACKPQQREINLDDKHKSAAAAATCGGHASGGENKERPPKPGEVLKWKFGT